MKNLFELSDAVGPEKIVHIANRRAGLQAIVVIDNVSAGPAIGGTRMAPDVSVEECARLARAMTYKNAAAGLKHGGAKSVIFADPGMPVRDKEQVLRAFANAIKDLHDYIPGPDMGTDETSMAWIHDEIGRSVGLPRVIGGIPLDEIGATGLGVAVAAEAAQAYCDVRIKGARVAVQGFGAVGEHAARFLAERGAVLVAAADSRGAIFNPEGIDIDALVRMKNETGQVTGYADAQTIRSTDIVGVDCDIWIPAARPDVLNKSNAGDVKARLVVQGANIAATDEAEQILHERGVLSIPDFIANAGGVICAAVEYQGGTQAVATQEIREKVGRNTSEVLSRARQGTELPRLAAIAMAQSRVFAAMALGRWH